MSEILGLRTGSVMVNRASAERLELWEGSVNVPTVSVRAVFVVGSSSNVGRSMLSGYGRFREDDGNS